ncbi:MAG: hypothetical protein RR183_09365 [Bacteroidales bacterium]
MKVEHVTHLGSTTVRDTASIDSKTIEFFKGLQITDAFVDRWDIKDTEMNVKLTVSQNIALLNMNVEKMPIALNVFCFSEKDKEPCMLYVRDFVEAFGENVKDIKMPKSGAFIYTVLTPFSAIHLSQLQLAGEIELYIYDAVRRAINAE